MPPHQPLILVGTPLTACYAAETSAIQLAKHDHESVWAYDRYVFFFIGHKLSSTTKLHLQRLLFTPTCSHTRSTALSVAQKLSTSAVGTALVQDVFMRPQLQVHDFLSLGSQALPLYAAQCCVARHCNMYCRLYDLCTLHYAHAQGRPRRIQGTYGREDTESRCHFSKQPQ